MKGTAHLIIFLAGMLGLFAGSIVIDLSHQGTWQDKLRCFVGKDAEGCVTRGKFHQPVVILSVAMFSFCLSLGLLFHYIMDWRL